MVSKAAYEATQLDTSRLVGYAKRVARETRRPAKDAVRERLTKQETYLEPESYGLFGMRTREVSKARTVEAGWKTIVDEHWVLHTTYHNIDKHEPGGIRSITRIRTGFCLRTGPCTSTRSGSRNKRSRPSGRTGTLYMR
jgi:hypothetical protein